MANLKLTNDYWETSGVYDFKQKKTQRVINDDVITKIGTTTMGTTATTLTGAIKELNDKATSLQGQISAYVETTDTASRAYSVGQYVVWKGTLYRVTTSITNGGTITSSKLTAVTATAEISGKAPTNHASTATTYGKGTSTNYGHVKISDSLTDTTTAATGGVVPSMKAVSDLNGAISDAATTNLLDTLPKTNGTFSGVTITWLGDGSVKANGTCSSTNWCTVYQSITHMPSGIVAGQTYKTSMKTSNAHLYMIILAYSGSSWSVICNTATASADPSMPVSFTVPANATGFWVRINLQGNYTFSNDIAKPVIYAADALSGAIAPKTTSPSTISIPNKTLFFLGNVLKHAKTQISVGELIDSGNSVDFTLNNLVRVIPFQASIYDYDTLKTTLGTAYCFEIASQLAVYVGYFENVTLPVISTMLQIRTLPTGSFSNSFPRLLKGWVYYNGMTGYNLDNFVETQPNTSRAIYPRPNITFSQEQTNMRFTFIQFAFLPSGDL